VILLGWLPSRTADFTLSAQTVRASPRNSLVAVPVTPRPEIALHFRQRSRGGRQMTAPTTISGRPGTGGAAVDRANPSE
jgi:hypothetical protein